MNWAWAGPLVVAALGAGVGTALSRKVRRETEDLRLARVEVSQARSRLSTRRSGSGVPTGPAK